MKTRYGSLTFKDIHSAWMAASRGVAQPNALCAEPLFTAIVDRISEATVGPDGFSLSYSPEMLVRRELWLLGEEPFLFLGGEIRCNHSIPEHEIHFINETYPEQSRRLVIGSEPK